MIARSPSLIRAISAAASLRYVTHPECSMHRIRYDAHVLAWQSIPALGAM